MIHSAVMFQLSCGIIYQGYGLWAKDSMVAPEYGDPGLSVCMSLWPVTN